MQSGRITNGNAVVNLKEENRHLSLLLAPEHRLCARMAPPPACHCSVGRIVDKSMLGQHCLLSRNYRTSLPINAPAEQNSFVARHLTCFSASCWHDFLIHGVRENDTSSP
jgi:hypothetical protein